MSVAYREDSRRYQQFIDDLVDIAKSDTVSNRIKAHGYSERVNEADMPLTADEQKRKQLFASFNDDQKLIIAEMLLDSRQSAIHDVCAHLEWLHSSQRLTLTFDGECLPTSQFYGTMHMDFVCRLSNDEWLEEGV